MATTYPISVTAAQVGTYFVGQYYQVLQQQPEFVHQFYSDGSTMIRIDGNTRDTATAMLQIHALVMSLDYTGIEIRSAHALESWNAGVLVMVSGSVQLKDFSTRRKFVQIFFLAPQEKGYFVLNDIFQFIEDDTILHHHHHPAIMIAQSNLDSKRNGAVTAPEPVSNYLLGGEINTREFAAPDVKENGQVDNYGFAEQRRQQVTEPESILEDNSADQSNGSLQNTANSLPDHLPQSVEEPVGEPQKHTYASILRVVKGQPTISIASHNSSSKNAPLASDWNHSPPPAQLPMGSSTIIERSTAEATDELASPDDEGEIKSVYVRNLPPTVSPSEIEEEFKNFGKLKETEGVVIRSHKDVGVCYAFVEFEDITGVQNAIKAATVQIAGRQVHIEERRPNSYIPSRLARRGRGRGGYQVEAQRGRFGARNFGRGGGHDVGDRDYNRPRGNGFYRPTARHDRGNAGHQPTRNGAEVTS